MSKKASTRAALVVGVHLLPVPLGLFGEEDVVVVVVSAVVVVVVVPVPMVDLDRLEGVGGVDGEEDRLGGMVG
jgi:hypothetical protein